MNLSETDSVARRAEQLLAGYLDLRFGYQELNQWAMSETLEDNDYAQPWTDLLNDIVMGLSADQDDDHQLRPTMNEIREWLVRIREIREEIEASGSEATAAKYREIQEQAERARRVRFVEKHNRKKYRGRNDRTARR